MQWTHRPSVWPTYEELQLVGRGLTITLYIIIHSCGFCCSLQLCLEIKFSVKSFSLQISQQIILSSCFCLTLKHTPLFRMGVIQHSDKIATYLKLCAFPLWDTLKAFYPSCCCCCCWEKPVTAMKVSITPFFFLPVNPVTGRCGTCLSGSGPPLPALLFHLAVLPAEKKRGPAQRRLLLHSLVCHYCNACL